MKEYLFYLWYILSLCLVRTLLSLYFSNKFNLTDLLYWLPQRAMIGQWQCLCGCFTFFTHLISLKHGLTKYTNFKMNISKYEYFKIFVNQLLYIASKKESMTLHPPLPVVWVLESEVCVESDRTRVDGIETFSRIGLVFWIFLAFFLNFFFAFSLAFMIPTCWYHKREERRERKIQNTSETTHSVIRPVDF